jgi:hypothetical protein
VGRTRLAITAFVVAILFISVIAVTIVYYKPSTLPLVTALNIVEMENNSMNMAMFPEIETTYFYDCLWIKGSITNTGKETAYNAGLKVVAYDSKGTLQINMTIPLTNGAFGTSNATNAFVIDHHRIGTYTKFDSSPWRVDRIGSLELGSLNGGQTTNVTLAIFHEGTVTSWNVTPVWTNNP